MLAFMQVIALMPPKPRHLFAPAVQTLSEQTIQAVLAAKGQESSRRTAARLGIAQSTVVRLWNGGIHTAKRRVIRLHISDDAVEEMRVRHEECGWTLTQCARFYCIPKQTASYILKYRRR